MRVLSLFDGIGTGLLALKNAKIEVDEYYASEIETKAIETAKKNHPEIIELGDVKKIDVKRIGKIEKEWENLWNSTIKKSDLDCYGWDANPWVWVIEFERCAKPAESPYAWDDAIEIVKNGGRE